MSKGYVYILSNPSMPGLVKIGKTTCETEVRASQLYQTGVPTHFKIEHDVYSPDCHELERDIHLELQEQRLNLGREFFRISVEDAIKQLDSVHECQVNNWLYDFIPGALAVHWKQAVRRDHLEALAEEGGVDVEAIARIMSELTLDELRAAAGRLCDKYGYKPAEAAE